MASTLEDGILTEWVVSSQGYVESASATWITRNAERIRVTELLQKGRIAERDAAIVNLLEGGDARRRGPGTAD